MSKGAFHIVVKNDAEVARAFRQVRRDTLKELRPTLRLAAEPVRQMAASLFAEFDARSAAGYKVRVRLKGVAVEQSLRRTTGEHPFYGSLQMQKALLPALAEKGPKVVDDVERMIDLAGIKAGL